MDPEDPLWEIYSRRKVDGNLRAVALNTDSFQLLIRSTSGVSLWVLTSDFIWFRPLESFFAAQRSWYMCWSPLPRLLLRKPARLNRK